jgi:signal transduction histidine kinase/ligand-binding sensor domain-containing protein
MSGSKAVKTKFRYCLIVFCLIFGFQCAALAEQLPFKTYTSADGLANDTVNKIVRDSRGFLWFCTAEGLSRFDGYKFKNYTQEQGLPHRSINDFLETKNGDYLLATSGGLAVFNPHGKVYRWNIIEAKLEQNSDESPLFKTYLPADAPPTGAARIINVLGQDANGNIYAGTNYALYRFIETGADWRFERVEYAEWKEKNFEFNDFLRDARGNFWIATNHAVYRILKSGEIEKISDQGATSFFQGQDGKVWVDGGGNAIGIRVYGFDERGKPVLRTVYTKQDGLLTDTFTNAVAQTPDGRVFINSDSTLMQFIPNADAKEAKFQTLDISSLRTAANYQNQSIWLGFWGKGVRKFTTENFVSFSRAEGVPERISSLFTDSKGEICFTYLHQLFGLVNGKTESVAPRGMRTRSWGGTFLDFQSKDGDWWVAASNGLLRYKNAGDFKDLARAAPAKIYTTADGLQTNEIFTMFEDSRGDIWISTIGAKNFLHRLEKESGKIVAYTTADGLPADSMAISYGEDVRGNVWLSFYGGELARFKDGTFRVFTNENLIPRGGIAKMLSDSKGRLWLAASSRGLFRVDAPDAETPVFTNISTADGLPSNQTFFAVEDNFGRIFIGTGRGIARLEPETGKFKIYTTSDGLPTNISVYGLKDKSGNLWFASFDSITKFTPQADKPTAPPPIFIDGISVNGTARNISDLGETEIKNLEFSPEERRIQISFFAISFESGETLRYQYKLGDAGWSAPSTERSVSFDLAAGSYDFAVRAVNSDGAFSDKSATFSFKILSPIWQRWWFLTLAFLIVAGAIFALDRYRVAKTRQIESALEELRKSKEERLAELQRVRTRIATDLHDDIGSSLTQIAVLSEVARGQANSMHAENLMPPLERIKNVSKELVAVMSDVVWAINPQKDFLHDLVQRMRRFASDVFTGRGIKFEFVAPELEDNPGLGANVRREVFAIFKESVNNSVKYSECTTARAELSIEKNRLILQISDNGKGFDTKKVLGGDFKPEIGGNGLINMKRRAAELGGTCEISSVIGRGTNVKLMVPLQIPQNGFEKL